MKEYKETFKKFCEENERFLVLYVGSVDPTLGKSWCDDCRDAKPVIMKIIPKLCKEKGFGFFICEVGDKQT